MGDPRQLLGSSPVAPPIVRLGRLAGWSPPPLSVRDARRRAAPLRDRLAGLTPPPGGPAMNDRVADGPAVKPVVEAEQLVVRYGPVVAVRGVDLRLWPGQVTALMGRNGSGKSSLLWALHGGGLRAGGRIRVAGIDPGAATGRRARQLVALVPQTAADLVYLNTVGEECEQADRESGVAVGTCRGLLDRFAPHIEDDTHPADLSEGQRLALVLAIQLTPSPPVILLDEPTRGLDYDAKERLGQTVRDLTRTGRSVVVATHDVEFVARVADRVIVLADGDVVADGPVADVIVASPAFAPQVAKILAPLPWLTVEQVKAALTPDSTVDRVPGERP
jgi:energy-coupling factor transport system ATP-binding protein